MVQKAFLYYVHVYITVLQVDDDSISFIGAQKK